MTDTTPQAGPFIVQPVLTELYEARDLLDLSAPSPATPQGAFSSSPQPSLFSSATSIAAAAGRRAAAVAGAASPSSSQSPFRNAASPERNRPEPPPAAVQKVEARCIEGYGPNLYVGRSDGVVEWWVCDGSVGTSQAQGWSLKNKYTVFPRRPISKIVLMPQVGRAFALSEGTLHPLALPNLDTIPPTNTATLRGIINVILDDDQLEWNGPASEEAATEMTMVVVRRRGLGIYRVGQRMVSIKDIPLPAGPTYAALTSTFLCAAIPSEQQNTYSIIDLSDASLTEVLPVSQVDPEVADFEVNPNIVVIPGENEFLVTSYTGVSTMGVFLNGQGDPVRGTMEWPSHPVSIAIEASYVIALLKDGSIVIHKLDDLEKPVQTIEADTSLAAIGLCYSPYGIAVRDMLRDERLKTGRMLLLSDPLAPSQVPTGTRPVESPPQGDLTVMSPGESDAASPEPMPLLSDEPLAGSGLTPPSSPPNFARQPIVTKRQSSLLQATAPPPRGPFSTTITETLVFGPNAICFLAPAPVILQVEKLCGERRMEEAVAAVDEERRRGRRGEVDVDKITHHATMRYLHLYLACHLLLEAMFEKAGEYFHRGKVDPRLIVRLFPVLRGKVIGSAEEVEVYEGLRVVLEEMPTVDEIIGNSIRRNYSPHVSPNSERAPETVELRSALQDESKIMLTELLRKTRASRRKGGGARGVDSRKIDIVIDTTLAKLLAEAGTTNELLALLAAPNDVVLSELEPFLTQRPYVLSTVMRQQGRTDRVLELLKGMAESPDVDPLCEDPVDEVAQQLESVTDSVLFRQYALWLVSKDADKGLAIILSQGFKPGMKFDDASLISDLHAISPTASGRYLEYVVVNKRSPNRQLHEDLLSTLLEQGAEQLRDDGVKYHLEELEADYRLQVEPDPFCVFLAEVAPPSPIKMIRLKLMLFLQGSPFYSLQTALAVLEKPDMGLLKSELAVVLGRLGNTRQALQLLARDLGDGVSAQTYCTQGGEIIPPKVARRVAQRVPELEPWASLGEVGRKKRGTVDPSTQEKLVMELLGVYMRDGAATSKQTAALLNAQSLHLDALEVLDLVPPDWPLDDVSSFFKRSLRRQIHDRASWQILKSISAGQNLQVSEAYQEQVRKVPPLVLEPSPAESFPSQPDEGSIAEKEYEQMDEKLAGDGTREKGEGFFDADVVDKELRELQVNPAIRSRGRDVR